MGVCFAAILFSPTLAAVQAQGHSDLKREFSVKAGFLKNFLKYINLPLESNVVRICISAPPEILAIFQQLHGGQAGGQTSLQVREFSIDQPPESCDVVYVSRRAPVSAERILQIFSGQNALLIGDEGSFAEKGGVIQFLEKDGKIRFRINFGSAKSRNIEINSQLLRLAEVINNGHGAAGL